ncbi:hypothetical protein MZO42_07000 [Sphingomonas psychrotolerans]|uniref:ShlB/FhaC/HecB family hemolysin secretion/activation protein n=1 Tax=Sphingomonas psychrotolerans TaxID=1327635 RepID=A0ABU3N3I9_9SPHN|nr:ShlB/FhaC/HecB family hemolysin secretion/activation protein [Sphingomonas psychrotolerans]MDT8758439.1 hypothetical protein [Sphingomonas psychrotolerans]
MTITPMAAPARAQEALDRVAPNASTRESAPTEAVGPAAKTRVEIDAPSGSAASTSGSLLVGAVTLKGLQVLRPADFADIVSERVGRTLEPADLSALATAVADRARDKGLAFATASIGAQRLPNGILTIDVDEGRIDELRFDGPVQPAVRAALAPLADGRVARLSEVERRLLIAGDIDGVVIANSRFFRENGRGILLVKVGRERVAARVALSNDGTRPLGPLQMRIDVDLNGLLASDDSVTLTWSGTPVEPGELQFGRIRYAKRINRGGTELALTASGSAARPGAYLDRLDIESRSWFVGASLLQPLARRRAESLWLEAELGVRDLRQWRADERVRHDRLTVARLTLYGYSSVAGGRLRVSTTLSQGLGLFGSTGPRDPLASRYDADGTFTSLSAWADWTRSFGGDFSIRLAALSQLASQPLLIAEETSLGGTAFLRGYDWSERTGDEGAMGMAELRYDWKRPFGLLRRAQLYAYVDGGEVENLDAGFGGGALASAGGGVRADITRRTGANFELAVPLSGPRYDTGDRAPKLNFRLVRSF